MRKALWLVVLMAFGLLISGDAVAQGTIVDVARKALSEIQETQKEIEKEAERAEQLAEKAREHAEEAQQAFETLENHYKKQKSENPNRIKGYEDVRQFIESIRQDTMTAGSFYSEAHKAQKFAEACAGRVKKLASKVGDLVLEAAADMEALEVLEDDRQAEKAERVMHNVLRVRKAVLEVRQYGEEAAKILENARKAAEKALAILHRVEDVIQAREAEKQADKEKEAKIAESLKQLHKKAYTVLVEWAKKEDWEAVKKEIVEYAEKKGLYVSSAEVKKNEKFSYYSLRDDGQQVAPFPHIEVGHPIYKLTSLTCSRLNLAAVVADLCNDVVAYIFPEEEGKSRLVTCHVKGLPLVEVLYNVLDVHGYGLWIDDNAYENWKDYSLDENAKMAVKQGSCDYRTYLPDIDDIIRHYLELDENSAMLKALEEENSKLLGYERHLGEYSLAHVSLYVTKNPSKLREKLVKYMKSEIDKLASKKVLLKITLPSAEGKDK